MNELFESVDNLFNSNKSIIKEDESALVCRVDMPISVAKGSVHIDDEDSYSTSNARTIFTDKKVYYSNNVPVDDEDFIKGGPWWMPRFQCNIKLYNDKECTDLVGTLEKVSDDLHDDLRSKYREDYWGGVSYNISVKAEFYNADTDELIWKGKEW